MCFWHQNGAIALLGERSPQLAIESNGVAAVAEFPQMRDRRALGQERLDAVAQHALFFVQYECHVH